MLKVPWGSNQATPISAIKQFRFSMSILEYGDQNGYKLFRLAEAIWHYTEGRFTYGRYTFKDIEYNVAKY